MDLRKTCNQKSGIFVMCIFNLQNSEEKRRKERNNEFLSSNAHHQIFNMIFARQIHQKVMEVTKNKSSKLILFLHNTG